VITYVLCLLFPQGFVDLPIPEMTDAILHLTRGQQVVSRESFVRLAEDSQAMDVAKEREEKALKEVFSWMDVDGYGTRIALCVCVILILYQLLDISLSVVACMRVLLSLDPSSYTFIHTYIYVYTCINRACGCGQAEEQDVRAAHRAEREGAAPPDDDG
jgi:hypothetical protein